MGNSGKKFLSTCDKEEVRKIQNVLAEKYEASIRRQYGNEIADEYHQLIEKTKSPKLENVIVSEFRYLTTDDLHDLKYEWCSRCYEYPVILDFLNKVKPQTVHNTSAGYADWLYPRQLMIMEALSVYDVIHTDIEATPKFNIKKFNIVSDKHETKYDVVLNISVIEHLPVEQQIPALNNLLSIVNEGGYLVLTFDVPRVDLIMIENWCGAKCQPKPINAVSGANSIYQQLQYSHLNFVLLIIQKYGK